MPLVFVHGVATRQTDRYKEEVRQRDQLFQRLIMDDDRAIFDPDWGSGAVKFAKMGWVPRRGAAEPFAFGTARLGPGGPSAAAIIAGQDVEQAIDLAFGAMLAVSAEESRDLTDEQLAAFDAAVAYLEVGPDRTAFAPGDTDAQFAKALQGELSPLLPTAPGEAMGAKDIFAGIGRALKALTDPLRNVGSDAVLGLIRTPLSNQVALFLGDIFVYLRWRETDGAAGTYNRIFKPIIEDLAAANAARAPGQKLVVVAHSLGAVILYDLLTDPRALAEIARISDQPLEIDHLVTVGAQPGLFADMGLYDRTPDADGKLDRPVCVRDWMNIYDFTDVLSFRTTPFFNGVEDFEFDNVSGALEAHTAYFQRPGFYRRLRKRLKAP